MRKTFIKRIRFSSFLAQIFTMMASKDPLQNKSNRKTLDSIVAGTWSNIQKKTGKFAWGEIFYQEIGGTVVGIDIKVYETEPESVINMIVREKESPQKDSSKYLKAEQILEVTVDLQEKQIVHTDSKVGYKASALAEDIFNQVIAETLGCIYNVDRSQFLTTYLHMHNDYRTHAIELKKKLTSHSKKFKELIKKIRLDHWKLAVSPDLLLENPQETKAVIEHDLRLTTIGFQTKAYGFKRPISPHYQEVKFYLYEKDSPDALHTPNNYLPLADYTFQYNQKNSSWNLLMQPRIEPEKVLPYEQFRKDLLSTLQGEGIPVQSLHLHN